MECCFVSWVECRHDRDQGTHTKRLMPPPTKRIYQVPKEHSTGLSYPRTLSIESRSWRPHDPPSSFQTKGQARKRATAPNL